MGIGNIYNFNHDKGFGFIRPNNPNDSDVLVYATELAKAGINVFSKVQLKKLITFEVSRGNDNIRRAINVKILDAN